MDGIAAAQRRSRAYDAGDSDSEIEVDDEWNYLCRGRKRRVSAGDVVGREIAAVTSVAAVHPYTADGPLSAL
eukprot:8334-Heterococcus_DN1.PRE.2